MLGAIVRTFVSSIHQQPFKRKSTKNKTSKKNVTAPRKKRRKNVYKKEFRTLNPKRRSELRVGAADMAREGNKSSGVARRPRNLQHATPAKRPSGTQQK